MGVIVPLNWKETVNGFWKTIACFALQDAFAFSMRKVASLLREMRPGVLIVISFTSVINEFAWTLLNIVEPNLLSFTFLSRASLVTI